MPTKPKSGCWQTSAPPETLLQQNAFIDSCTAWLVEQHASRASETFVCRTACPEEDARGHPLDGPTEAQPTIANLSYTPLELRVTSRSQSCFFCGTRAEEMHAVMANPFAQRHFVIVCASCRV